MPGLVVSTVSPGAADGSAEGPQPLGAGARAVLDLEPCRSPTPDGQCVLRLGHPVGPWLPGHGGHLP